MKKWGGVLFKATLVFSLLILTDNAFALSPETELLLRLLEKKGLITQQEADELRREVEAAAPPSQEQDIGVTERDVKDVEEEYLEGEEEEHIGGVKGLAERTEDLERMVKGIELGGTIEVEATYERFSSDENGTEESSDLTLASAELSVNVGITDQIKGYILFDYEEEDDNNVTVDEAIIHIRAEEVCVPDESCGSPWYASAGRLYVPFGYFESHFINDPVTLELGETRESAVVAGLANNWINVSGGVFNGDVDERGEDDDHIDNFVASARLTVPEGTIPEVELMAGASYINNIAESDELQDAIPGNEIADYVDGLSLFLHLVIMDEFFVEAEYVAAMDDFDEHDLDLESGEHFEPRAWNIELAYTVLEDLQIAVRYEGSDNALDFLPEWRCGGVINYNLFENTLLALEYLYGEFENNDEETTVTSQLAIEF